MAKRALVIAIVAAGLVSAQEEKQIWDTYFGSSREKAKPESGLPSPATRPQHQYQRVSNKTSPANAAVGYQAPTRPAARALGVTIWKMEKSRPDDPVRLLVQEDSRKPKAEYTAYRHASTDVLSIGDRVRVTVEATEGGYLYVIDQELLADGRLGPPYLIFPVTKVRGGDNRISPGQLTEIPARTDKIAVFTIQPRAAAHLGEKLTFLLTPDQLPHVKVSAAPQRLSEADFRAWESDALRSQDAFELAGTRRQAWTTAEDEAGQDRRLLTLDDPAPQTVFAFAGKSGGALLATVILTIAPARPPNDEE